MCKMEKLPILTTAVEYVYTMQTNINEKLKKQAQLRAKIALMQGRSIGHACACLQDGFIRGVVMQKCSAEGVLFGSLFTVVLTYPLFVPEKIAALKASTAIRPGSLVRWGKRLVSWPFLCSCAVVFCWQVYRQVYPHKPFPTVVIDARYKIVDCSYNFLSMINVSKSQARDPRTLLAKCPELEQIFP